MRRPMDSVGSKRVTNVADRGEAQGQGGASSRQLDPHEKTAKTSFVLQDVSCLAVILAL